MATSPASRECGRRCGRSSTRGRRVSTRAIAHRNRVVDRCSCPPRGEDDGVHRAGQREAGLGDPRTHSNAATTPSAPSRAPPLGTEAMCEPLNTGGTVGSAAAGWATMLPRPSSRRSRPAYSQRAAYHCRVCASCAEYAVRAIPSPKSTGTRPIWVRSSRLRLSRAASTRRPTAQEPAVDKGRDRLPTAQCPLRYTSSTS
jgi:hypothetical protein